MLTYGAAAVAAAAMVPDIIWHCCEGMGTYCVVKLPLRTMAGVQAAPSCFRKPGTDPSCWQITDIMPVGAVQFRQIRVP